MYTNFFPICINGHNSKDNVDYDYYPILCDSCDNLILSPPNCSNLGGNNISQNGDINYATGMPLNYSLGANRSDKVGSINSNNTDSSESLVVSNNSEQVRNENPYSILSNLRKKKSK